MKINSPKTQTKNSPPSKGGVPLQRRGGFQFNRLESSKETTTPALRASPPLEGGELGSPNVEKIKINNLPHLKTFRKELRNNLTPAEAKFWKIVQNKNFEGRKFRRQHSVGNYILDFYCPSEKLAVELDGEVHFGDAAREYDRERKLFLEYYGIKVLRFENKRVFEDLGWMINVIKSNFGWNKKTTPSLRDTPPLEGGEFDE